MTDLGGPPAPHYPPPTQQPGIDFPPPASGTQVPAGAPAYGETAYGQSTYANTTYAQPTYNQTPYAPPEPPQVEDESQIPIWVLLVIGGIVLALLAAGAFLVLRPTKPEAAKPTYPSEWDSRIAPFVKIAEKKRDLRFTHPVEVKFLSETEFKKTVTVDPDKVTKAEQAELESYTGLLRAFGLITGDVDLLKANNDASSAGYLAYYSFDDETITIRGKKITPAMRSTVVHELTHVLQDQNFGVGDRMASLMERDADGEDTSGAVAVLRAIVEGDATRVEGLYRESLSKADRKALDASRKEEGAAAGDGTKGVPTVLLTLMGAPYALGQGFVEATAAEGKNTAVDILLRDPPTDEIALLAPLQELTLETESVKVDVPEVRKGEKKFESGELGALTWYLMLAERLPLADALEATDGWGGDGYVAYETDGKTCARMKFTGSTKRGTDVMLSALRRWVAAAPGSPARVVRNGEFLKFESCDPGAKAEVGKDASVAAIGLVSLRTYIGIALMNDGSTTQTANCLAGRLVDTYSVAQLSNPEFGATDPAIQARIRAMAATCD